jgi:hypothetical protein
MSEDQKKYEDALRLQNEGKYQDAINVARNITHSGAKAGIFIDCGYGIAKPSLIREGIALFEELLQKGNSGISKASLLYNIGNGYHSIYMLRQHKGVKVIPPNDDDLRKAKWAYRESLQETKGNSKDLRSQMQVNYGNCLAAVGRSIEAIDTYNDALISDTHNGMAAGNLGVELDRIADITGKYRHHYLQAAFEMLSKALSPEMHLSYGGIEVRKGLEHSQSRIKMIIDGHKDGIEPLKNVNLSEYKDYEQDYITFCLHNQLFLNAWVGDQNVTPAISDEIRFGPITTSVGDIKTVPTLLQILNEIKEAYSSARYLYYLSQSETHEFNNISKLTSYFDFGVETKHGLSLGLCKSAYTRSFDVLDKVARITNTYFKIGSPRSSFWEVFAEKQSKGQSHEKRFVARPAIVTTKNPSLYALSDLCIDYFESEHVDLKSIDTRRNLLTHDFLSVVENISEANDFENGITKGELHRQTLSVLRLAKYAVLYIVSAVYISEEARQNGAKTLSIKYNISWGDN